MDQFPYSQIEDLLVEALKEDSSEVVQMLVFLNGEILKRMKDIESLINNSDD